MTFLEALLERASGNIVNLPDQALTHTRDPVPGEGPLDAKIIVLGEFPSFDDEENGRLFSNKAGQKLRNHMRLAGIHPEKCYITTVIKTFPPGGSVDNVDPGVIRQWQTSCLEELAQCRRASLVVAVGNLALATLCGFEDITRRRGSVYAWQGKQVVPIIHPAAVLRRSEFEKHSRLDWERIKALTTSHETHHMYCGCAPRQERTHITPFSDERLFRNAIKRYKETSQNPQKVLAIDIETPKMQGKRQIVCVSFAFSPNESLVLPWPARAGTIEELCESPCIKVGHNFVSFDRWWLNRAGIRIKGELRDTLTVHHCLDPASAHSLEYLTSILLYEPWYKDDGKGHDENVIFNSDASLDSYYRYCGLDSCCTVEIHDRLWPELERRGMVDFYRRHYEALYDPILDLMTEGVFIDHERRKTLLTELLSEARTARDRLGQINQAPLFTLASKRDGLVFDLLGQGRNPLVELTPAPYTREQVEKSLETLEKKTVSNTQLKVLLYDKLGIPLQTKRRSSGEETATADAVALRKIRLAYADDPKVCEVVDLAMGHNKAQKLASFLYPNTFDEDGKFRFTLKLNTEASRLASAKAPNGTGQNSQNLPREARLSGRPINIRSVFLPDPGHVILEGDASQIEGRIVFVRTQDPDLIKLGRARTDFDQHAYTASLVFGKPIDQVGKGTEERQVAKSVSHACQRDMQGMTMADWMLKNNMTHLDNTAYSPEECESLIELYHKAFPGIRFWQQRIRKEVRARKKLINRWGRVWDVHYEEMNSELFRRAYNFLPQSECAEITNQLGFVALHRWLKKEKMKSHILLQEHDALVCSCAVEEVYDVACFLKESIEVELDYDGVGLVVPMEWAIGKNWGEGAEYKELPSREEFETKAKELVKQ